MDRFIATEETATPNLTRRYLSETDKSSPIISGRYGLFFPTPMAMYIVHMVRNSTRFISCNGSEETIVDLKVVYSIPAEDADCTALEVFGTIWNEKYPMIYQSWDSHWEDLNEFFNNRPEIPSDYIHD
jgi:transposase-like protein